MLIGVPKEIKVHEYRVGLTPESVRELVRRGHKALVQSGAGAGIGASDEDYRAAGATVAEGPEQVFREAELIVKVKEPLAVERARLRAGQAIFTYLHLAPDPEQAHELLASGATAIAYETVTAPNGGLPLLAPMSEVAGRMAIQIAAHYLARPQGGRGVLLSGATGVRKARVLVLGSGTVGANAARVAVGMGADVVVLGRSPSELSRLESSMRPSLRAATSSPEAIEKELAEADAVIGAALVAGALAPKLVRRPMLARMQGGSVLVDVSIDQGGCFETSRPTTHADPVYEVDGVIHYCVANMPGAVPRTSTYALNQATLPLVIELADAGIVPALRRNEHLRAGLNVFHGSLTCAEVAKALGCRPADPVRLLAA